MPIVLILAWVAAVPPQSTKPGGDALVAIQANLSVIKDVQFVFEGQNLRMNADGQPAPPNEKGTSDGEDYQGTYAYRTADGATYLDVYHQPRGANLPLHRTTQALLASKLEQLEQTPDLPRDMTALSHQNGGPGSLNTTASPELFVPLWIFREILASPSDYHYQEVGWEEVDGRRCRKVQVNEFYGYDLPEPRVVVYWVDLERGGLPLKSEYVRNGVVTRRTHGIQLRSIRAGDGHEAWIPANGVTDFFSSKAGEVAGQPFVRDTCTLVPSSIRINQGLNDSFFSVRRDSSGSPAGIIREARRRLDASSAASRAENHTRTDPQGVREKLAENLAEADHQAEEIKASSVARDSSQQPYSILIWAALVAAIALAVAFLARRRRP